MKSYIYRSGAWQVYDDSLPEGAEPRRHGFSDEDIYLSRLGKVRVYANQQKAFPLDFLCTLSIGGKLVRVWFADFPALLLFLKEIDAQYEISAPIGDEATGGRS